jgi:hypothetical protein
LELLLLIFLGVGVLIAHLENNMLSEQASHHKVKMPNPQNQSSHLFSFSGTTNYQ